MPKAIKISISSSLFMAIKPQDKILSFLNHAWKSSINVGSLLAPQMKEKQKSQYKI